MDILYKMIFFLYTAEISDIKDKLVDSCDHGVPLVLEMEETMHNMELFGHGNPGIAALESSLLDVGSADFLQGLFYILPIYHDRKLFVRYSKLP